MFGVEARGIFSLQRPRTPRWACLGVRRDEIVKTRITCPYGARYSCLLHENVREHQKRAQLGRVFVVHRKGKGVKGSVGGEGAEHVKHADTGVFYVFGEGVLGWGTGYPRTRQTRPYGRVCRVRGEVEGIGGGRVRKREKHEKCAYMGTFLWVFRVSGESGSGWALARGYGRELRGRRTRKTRHTACFPC